MQSIYFSAHHDAFRSDIRSKLTEHVVPFAQSWEDARLIPREGWIALGRNGLLGLRHSTNYGGRDLDLFHSIAFLEELGRLGYGGIRAAISVHAYMASHYIAKHASPALQDKYLPASIRGEKIAALAITESQAGSDLARLATTATPIDDAFSINGEKTFITNGINADYFVVAARTGPLEAMPTNTGISLVLVDARSAGVSVTSQEKIGWHSAGTACIRFSDTKVPASNVVGRLNGGFAYLMKGFQLERLVAAVLALGGADYCLADTVAHISSRQAFSGKLSELQTIRHRIAGFATDLAAARMLAYHAAWRYQDDELSVSECSMAKLRATQLASQIADECLQLQGARGYLANSNISRVYRDARAGTMAGGASEIMQDIIAQQIIDMHAEI